MKGTSATLSGVFAGRYTIEREVGRGATAVVYLARDESQNRAVAIKILRAELVTEISTERFLREIRVTARLRHPNIVPVLDSGEYDDRLFFVLPFMEGGTLRARLEREKQLPVGEVITIGTTIATALQFAHEHKLLHRDVKPENILFTGGQACLADFGIARALSESSDSSNASSTSTGVVRGTPAYMSPEQAAGDRDIDGRSDVYSLACVLYETLAGVAAFVGPTPQSVLSQRLAHVPRGVRVYRPAAPAELERVLEKALALAPADRYQTAAEFSAALAAIDLASSPRVATSQRPHRRFRWQVALPAGLIVSAIAVAALIESGSILRAPPVAPDTTMLAVLPLDGTDSSRSTQSRELLQEALARWRGIALVDHYQVIDAYRRRGGIRTTNDAASLAISLGAGRYIRGEVSRTADAWRASVSLYDAATARELQHATADIPSDLSAARAAYAQLANALLLRGVGPDTVRGLSTESRVLPAVQAFFRAQRSLDDWDLAAADSVFEQAVGYDPDYARANLWLAQVRAWRDLPAAQWGTIAERAIAVPAGLSERELKLGQALVALSRAQYQTACGSYDELRRRSDADFAAWFGLGQCRTMDRIVIPDSASPSGWSYRSNYKVAIAAYARAFEILPSVHRGYERGAFERLRVLLLTSGTTRSGYGAADSAMFYARPAWIHGAFVLVPYPWQLVFSGDPRAIPPGFEEAIRHQRNQFRTIAAGWSAAFPRSADAKYAVALALELLGDRSSIDTIRLARRLTSDDSKRIRFAAKEATLLVKLGSPDRLEDLRAARALADSLLRTPAKLSASDRTALGPVAALAGRCDEAVQAARATIPVAAAMQFPQSIWLDAQTLVTNAALGCRTGGAASELKALAAAISREYGRRDHQVIRRVDEMLLSRPVLLADTPDSSLLARLASGNASARVEAAAALSRRDRAGARSRLSAVIARWQPALGAPTPDVLLPEARIWLALGDTVMATQRLDLTLTSARAYDPDDFTDAAKVAAFVRAMGLRADLAAAKHDVGGARRWAAAVAMLWAGADSELQPLVKRMSHHAGAQ